MEWNTVQLGTAGAINNCNYCYNKKVEEAPLPRKAQRVPSYLVGVLYDISRERICWWLINHFYAMGPESYEFCEITQNKAITPFKVIQGSRFWYQSKAYMRLPISD